MRPMKLAIVGGGPSGFYVAARLLSKLPRATTSLSIHVYDRLWAPYGLVRYGVAPDHPEVKASPFFSTSEAYVSAGNPIRNCTEKFKAFFKDTRIRFFGNVNVGDAGLSIPHAVQVPLGSLRNTYTHLLFATGSTIPKLHAALPPSERCLPALSVVHWYTQHPSQPDPPPLASAKHVSIIGNGNVALDVARMLLTDPAVLGNYDVPLRVLNVLRQSTVDHVSIIARRGPLEAAFTVKELRELTNLPNASMVPLDPSLLDPSAGTPLTRQQARTLQLLKKGSKVPFGSSPRTWSLDFYRSPTGLVHPYPGPRSAQLSLAHTIIDPLSTRALPTGETSVVNTDLVITSLGFHVEPTAPYYDPALAHLRTLEGRVITSAGAVVKNVYASGWAATGAKGIIANTMMNAYATADTIMADWKKDCDAADDVPLGVNEIEAVLDPNPDMEDPPLEVQQALNENLIVDYEKWASIDKEEIARGEAMQKERERMDYQEAAAFLASKQRDSRKA